MSWFERRIYDTYTYDFLAETREIRNLEMMDVNNANTKLLDMILTNYDPLKNDVYRNKLYQLEMTIDELEQDKRNLLAKLDGGHETTDGVSEEFRPIYNKWYYLHELLYKGEITKDSCLWEDLRNEMLTYFKKQNTMKVNNNDKS